ncbi:hypothetical protein H310_14388 [Aphanomyces invadans]|uniref:DUF1754-domain-containing protein n=1 Tax=Aphanomyces invadans TaxID=157072 RepID=A0A024TC69_9STRA|nr:hypothetical protein H310_14388 [Aphanomyces invadans]ETV90897.1 hypothetical protein H310_14388 [Aphanomyces invadans]|eukprot:XP_008880462.1 hypothetical protein H310_14388 [Aphanomyces invadans]
MEREKYGNVMGGKLSLKGKPLKESKKSKKKRKREHGDDGDRGDSTKKQDSEVVVPITGMTAAQQKHLKFKAKREEEDIKKQASKTYRERVDEYSKYLGNLSEHHDVPRVSAAGNG